MNQTTQTETIERYLNGTLTSAELSIFESALKTDQALNQELNLQKNALNALQTVAAQQNLRKNLHNIHQTIDVAQLRHNLNQQKTKRNKWLQLWSNAAVAAAAAAIVSLTFLTAYNHNSNQTEQYRQLRRDVKSITKSQQNLWRAYNSSATTQNDNVTTFAATGFPITPNGYMVTSYHVVADVDSIFAINETLNIRLKAEVVAKDAQKDLAILKITTQNFLGFGKLPYAIATTKMRIGEYVYTLGYPKTDIVFGEGSISSSSGFEGDTMAYQISIPVNSGNSGGPLINNSGKLLGIISGKNSGSEADGEGYAIKAQYLTQMIAELQDKDLQKELNAAQTKNTVAKDKPTQIAKLQKYIYRIEAYNH